MQPVVAEQMEILEFLGAVDSVQRKAVCKRNVDLFVLAEVLDLAL